MLSRLREVESDDAGFTMVEVIASLMVFAIVAIAVAAGVIQGIRSTTDERDRTAAASAAAEQLEKDRNEAIVSSNWWTTTNTTGDLKAGTTTYSYTMNNTPFTVTRTLKWVPKATVSNGCDSAVNAQGGNSAVQPVLLDTESVSWPEIGSRPAVTDQTTFTPPNSTFSGTGGIDIGVYGANGGGQSGIPVTVTNSSGTVVASLTTDSNGCAFASYLTSGTYTVSVQQANYVDTKLLNTSTCTQSVSNTWLNCTFTYDRAGYINWSYQSGCTASSTTFTAAQCPTVNNLNTVIVSNSGLNATGQYTNSYTSVASGTTALFPFTSGYNMYAGHCPSATTNGGGTVVGMSPGGTSTAVVPLYKLAMAMTSTSGSTWQLQSVSVQESTDTGSLTCSGTQTYTWPSAALTLSSPQVGVPTGDYVVTATAKATAGRGGVSTGTTRTTTFGSSSSPINVSSSGTSISWTLP